MKKNIVIGVLAVLVLGCLATIGNQESDLETAKASNNHWYNCSQQAIQAQAIAVDSYNSLVKYQNAGYIVDDYTAGNLTSDINKMNNSIKDYNKNCAGNDPVPTIST